MDKLAQIRKEFQKVIYKDGDIYVFYSHRAMNKLIKDIANMSEHYHEAKLKEELIKFIEWQLPSKNQAQINSRYKAVIEYIKYRTNG